MTSGPVADEPHRRIGRGGEIGDVRKVLAEMRAAAVAAEVGGGADGAADQRQVLEIEPVHPGEIVAAAAVGDAAVGDVTRQRIERRLAARQALGGAQDADVVPHDVVEPFAHFRQIAGFAAERREGALVGRLDRGLVRIRQSAGRADVRAPMTSPATPPNTVELATPLPPRRLAPCTPPVSSPAA